MNDRGLFSIFLSISILQEDRQKRFLLVQLKIISMNISIHHHHHHHRRRRQDLLDLLEEFFNAHGSITLIIHH
jgi:hypothetical protein